mmetsp:Transcript_39408/g.100699  ORF Transcript_39408/g.100699 Transcript_39408/m.100699 type:complete len:389 (-) Transcript_39408:42-1208(-)
MAGGSIVMREVVRSYSYVVLWMSISITVILFNKWLLAFSGFPYPIALTLWHMGFCSTVGILAVRVFKLVKSHNMSANDYMRRVMPIGVLYAASLWLSNSSYLYLSVSFIQMTKSLMPGLVYASGIALGTEKFSNASAANMCLIAFGVVVCAIGEVNLILKGVVQQLMALLFEATRLTMVQILINSRGLNMNPIQSIYYVSPACFVSLAIPFVFLEIPHMQASNDWKFHPSAFLANALAALALNLAVFLLIGKTSALTMNIAGVIKDWLLIFFSFFVFKAPVTAINLLGYLFCCAGVGVHQYLKLQAIKAKDALRNKAPDDNAKDGRPAGGGAAPSEPEEAPKDTTRTKAQRRDILAEMERLQGQLEVLEGKVAAGPVPPTNSASKQAT